jgi:hypothetical protein
MANSQYRHLFTNTIDGVVSDRNYVRNAFARENTSGWAVYANTAQSTPVNGTGSGGGSMVVAQNLSANSLFTIGGASTWYGQSFQPTATEVLGSVALSLQYLTSPLSGNMYVGIYSNSAPTTIGSTTGTITPGNGAGAIANNWIGQFFTASATGAVTSATAQIALATGAGCTGNLVAQLYTDNSGAPGTLLGSSVGFDTSTLSGTSFSLVTFTFTSGPTLTSGTSYHLVFDASSVASGGGDSDDEITVSVQTGTYLGHGYDYSNNSGSTWSNSGIYYLSQLTIYGGGTNTPGTLLATSSAVNASTLTSSVATITFPFTSGPTLTASTTYHLVLQPSGVTFSSNFIQGQMSTANPYAAGTLEDSSNSGSTWTPITGSDMVFTVTSAGSMPVITLTRNITNPLRFESDFEITVPASNAQGNGVSYNFTIDRADEDTLFNISFDYAGSANFAYGGTSDIKVFLYDVTSSTLIAVTPNNLATAAGHFEGTFTTTADTSYRVILHVATTNATGYTFEFTNFQLSTVVPGASGGGSSTLPFFTSSVISGGISTAVTSSYPTFTTFSNSPAFTITPTVTGTYRVYTSLPAYKSSSGNGYYRIINTSGGATLLDNSTTGIYVGSGSGSGAGGSIYTEAFYTLTAGNTYVFDFQGCNDGSGNVYVNAIDTPFYMFAQGLTVATPSSQFFTSNVVNTNSGGITGTGFVTFSNSPAFTFTPSVSGMYKVYTSVPLYQGNDGVFGYAQITNTSGGATLLSESQGIVYGAQGASGAVAHSAFLQNTYTLTAGTSYVFDIQGTNSSTGSIEILASNTQFYMYSERVG